MRVKNGRIAERFHCLIRPPRPDFIFTYLHGISWPQVSSEPSFGELWPRIQEAVGDAEFLAAHNARFDRKVLESCCASSSITPPQKPFICTVQLARRQWSIFPTKLSDVCLKLNIKLNHHEALSDAEACARIVLAAYKDGWQPDLVKAGTK